MIPLSPPDEQSPVKCENGLVLAIILALITFPVISFAQSLIPSPTEIKPNIFSTQVLSEGCDASVFLSKETRVKVARAAGQDIVQFVEGTASLLHAAKSDEEKLKIIAERFDHEHWVESLSQAATFLAQYNRVLMNSRRQEDSAMRAFAWSKEQQAHLASNPLLARASNLRSIECMKNEKDEYGCKRGESIWLVKLLVSPMIACRFPEKLDAYSIQFWVRMTTVGPRVIEIQANNQQLVRTAKEELASKKVFAQGSASTGVRATSLASLEGLNVERITALWRSWLKAQGSGKDSGKLNARSPSSL